VVEPASYSGALQDESRALWNGLTEHPFLVEMANGTLPLDTFRFYIDQNLLYLPEYARAISAGITGSRSNDELKWFSDAVANIIDVEIPENRELQAQVARLGGKPHPHAEVMAPATLAYTSYLTATARRSDAVGILALILPCAWSYEDIARANMNKAADHPVYREWLRFFTTQEYHEVVVSLRRDLDTAAREATPESQRHAAVVFRNGIRLEAAFWDMAYGGIHWPDLDVDVAYERSHDG
jgi:thiaminase/transcriptional activator TenA